MSFSSVSVFTSNNYVVYFSLQVWIMKWNQKETETDYKVGI